MSNSKNSEERQASTLSTKLRCSHVGCNRDVVIYRSIPLCYNHGQANREHVSSDFCIKILSIRERAVYTRSALENAINSGDNEKAERLLHEYMILRRSLPARAGARVNMCTG